PPLIRPGVRAGVPCLPQRDHMLDLYLTRAWAAHELDLGAGVGVVQNPRIDLTPIGSDLYICQVACEDLIPGLAAIPIDVQPSGPKLVSVIVGRCIGGGDRQRFHDACHIASWCRRWVSGPYWQSLTPCGRHESDSHSSH